MNSAETSNLSPAQAQVIAALVEGRTVTGAALDAGVHRNTIHHWLRNEPVFQAAMQEAQREFAAALADGIRDLAATALVTLKNLLEVPATPPAVRLKAALAILERKSAWNLPCEQEAPAAIEPAAARQIARNAPCPCGSGIKFKRCCGSDSPGVVNPPGGPRPSSTAREAAA